MKESLRASIPSVESAKDFLETIEKKYKKILKNEKNGYLNMLHSTIYGGVGGIRAHIDKLVACYQKSKAIGMDIDEDYMVWFVMGSLSF